MAINHFVVVTVQTRYECGLRASFVLKGQNIDCGQRKKTVLEALNPHGDYSLPITNSNVKKMVFKAL